MENMYLGKQTKTSGKQRTGAEINEILSNSIKHKRHQDVVSPLDAFLPWHST